MGIPQTPFNHLSLKNIYCLFSFRFIISGRLQINELDRKQQHQSSSHSNLLLENMSSVPLWSPRSHYRQTRKGKILQSTTEHYLRDDLGLGFIIPSQTSAKRNNVSVTVTGSAKKIVNSQELLTLLVTSNSKSLSTDKTRLVVVDTNVLLHNLDVLEHPSFAIANIIIPQTALVECRNRSFTAYNRVMDLLRSSSSKNEDEKGSSNKRCAIFFPDSHHISTQLSSLGVKQTINDENDARIRQVAYYYGEALSESGVDVVLLTDDKGCRELALKEQQENHEDDEKWKDRNYQSGLIYRAKSVRQHINELEEDDPELSLSDLVAQFTASQNQGSKKKNYFEPHISQNELSFGVKSGKYFQGYIRAERGSFDKSYVTVRQGGDRIAVSIIGFEDNNRAVDGDIVAIELHSIDSWLGEDVDEKAKDNNAASKVAGIAPETAEPSIRDESNVVDSVEIPGSSNVSMRKPTGKVVGVIRRNFKTNYCGSIFTVDKSKERSADSKEMSENELIASENEVEHSDGTTTCAFFPVTPGVPPVLVRTTQRDRLLGKRILIAIDSWPINSPFPLGHYVKTIGDTGGKDVETEVLLHEHNIPCDPFPGKVLACLPPEDYKITLEEGRLDLRHLPVLSIDPPGCKDIDDALHCIVLPNGNYQVGVHIADVTHYVKAGTAIDLEAANRSTSTYLVNKRLDMLPSLLTTDLCSLKGNVDRFAFSVLWETTPEADIVNVEFKKSVIHSIAALTYQQAQGMIDQTDDENDIKASAVKRLNSLARILRKRRIAAGALTLASPEVKFVLDSESLNPTDVQSYQLFEANALVEEFMLFANVTVSKKILRRE